MLTSELVEETRAILDDYSSAVSGDPDQLWSNERILRHLNKGQLIYCQRGWVLHDKDTADDGASPTPRAVCSVQLVENQYYYPLSPVLLKILSVQLSDSDVTLGQRNWDQIFTGPMPINNEIFDVNRTAVYDPGRPELYATDATVSNLLLWRKPDAASALLTANLRVIRLPLHLLTLDTDSEPEIDEQYQLDLAGYAAGTLLSRTANNDASARAHGRELRGDFFDEVTGARAFVKRMMLSTPRYIFGGWASE